MKDKKPMIMTFGKACLIIFAIALLADIIVSCIIGKKVQTELIEQIEDNKGQETIANKIEDNKGQENIANKEEEKENKKDEFKVNEKEDIDIVPTMQDQISKDSSWCATFQLVWNDMKNEIVEQDIVFNPQEKMAENLNKEEFKEDMISPSYYYKKYGLKTLELKNEIEKGIKEKFNQTSDILDEFNWSKEGLNNPNDAELSRYFFYTMLYRKFEFLEKFDVLKKGTFGKSYKNIEYFGIDNKTDNKVRKQIYVLYYNSKDDFAITINTKNGDEVTLCKNPEGNTFKQIYENINLKASKYRGKNSFDDIDEFKAPKINFNKKREYTEFERKVFKTKNGLARIEQAVQTIKFSLDENGGEIKSEAAVEVDALGMMETEPKEPRYFYLDDTFAIFLSETGRELPYFAGRIDDISKFQ